MDDLLRLTLARGLSAALLALVACDPYGRQPGEILAEGGPRGSAATESPAPAPPERTSRRSSGEAVAPPGEYSNLQVLPDDITKSELLETMKLVTKSLGVKCDFCHRTDIRDYASDEIEKKVIAREMMRMVEMINHQQFTWEGAPAATCFMCHHGQRTPRLEPAE